MQTDAERYRAVRRYLDGLETDDDSCGPVEAAVAHWLAENASVAYVLDRFLDELCECCRADFPAEVQAWLTARTNPSHALN